MEKEKIYIFIMHTVYSIGGTQMYVLGKSRYLHNNGWKCYGVFYGDEWEDNGIFHESVEYLTPVKGCLFLTTPPYRMDRARQDILLEQILRKLHLSKAEAYENAEIIVETFFPSSLYWGELLAARVQGRHFFCAIQESYRYLGATYEDNLDFFYFKWQRNEIITSKELLRSLFNGYKGVENFAIPIPEDTVHEQEPIQDVFNEKVEQIQRADWNICHFGRSEKDYVPYVIKGVEKLAEKYPDKKINFVFVGDAKHRLDLLDTTFQNCPNVNLIFLGDLAPVPRSLFSKIDVVCAISQSARFVANEGILTIVASANSPEGTPGVLGYDTKEQICGGATFTYFEALENVLVKRLYDDKEYGLPKLLPAEHYYEKFWTILKNAAPKKEYYLERLTQDRIRHWVAVFPFAYIARGAKIIFFGATEIAKDYRKQIEYQQAEITVDFGMHKRYKVPKTSSVEIGPHGIKELDNSPYCELLAVVDEHPENFDNSVVGLERLKTLDYDAIIITEYDWNAQRAVDKILEIVPQMKERIICHSVFFNIYLDSHRSTKYFNLQ